MIVLTIDVPSLIALIFASAGICTIFLLVGYLLYLYVNSD